MTDRLEAYRDALEMERVFILAEDEHEQRVTTITVVKKGEPVFSEGATTVSIVDEAAGEFVEVTQPGRVGPGISINPTEWPAISGAISTMLGRCRDNA